MKRLSWIGSFSCVCALLCACSDSSNSADASEIEDAQTELSAEALSSSSESSGVTGESAGSTGESSGATNQSAGSTGESAGSTDGSSDSTGESANSNSSSSTKAASSSSVYVRTDGDIGLIFSDAGVAVSNNAGECVVVSDKIAKIQCAGNYFLSGSSSDFSVQVAADTSDKVYLYLENLSLASASDAPIYAQTADKVFLVLTDGTENSLSDASTRANSWTYTNAKGNVKTDTTGAAIYAKCDLTFKGSGSLTVLGNYKNGIQTSKDIKIKDSPSITVNASNHGIKGKQSVKVEGGSFSITAREGDGIKSDEDDAESIADGKGYIQIIGGTFVIDAGDDGIQASNYILVDDSVSTPQLSITSGSDGIKTSSDSLVKNVSWADLNAGVITISAGDDGIDIDSTLNLNGATITVVTSVEGFEAATINANAGITSVYATDDGWNASNGTSSGQGGGMGGFGGGSWGGGSSNTGAIEPTINVNGGYHYVKTSNGDTDGIDSNGDINFNGGILVIEAGQNIIDVGDNNYTVNYAGGIVLGFGTQNEGVPSTGVSLCYGSSSGGMGGMGGFGGGNFGGQSSGSIASGTRYSAVSTSGEVLATITLTQSASQMIYIGTESATLASGGTYSGGTEVSFGLGFGGTLSGATTLSTSSCSSR